MDELPGMREAPIVKFVNAILLSALKKRATDIAIYRAPAASIVEFTIDGSVQEEMRPPLLLHAQVVRRLAIMANLPTYPKGMSAEGTIHLIIGDGEVRPIRHAYFAICVEGHGESMSASLRVVSFDEAPVGAA